MIDSLVAAFASLELDPIKIVAFMAVVSDYCGPIATAFHA